MLQDSGFGVIQVPLSEQDTVHQAIYDRNWGIKASAVPTDRVIKVLRDKVLGLADSGAEIIILGCTEIPLALTESELDGTPLLDPLNALARALIREADGGKLKPYFSSGSPL
jgi:aspartate racemase